ncbi:MAG: isoprenylcysteine carboxylmethyltransferase family protein [Nitrospirales bacterium]|nr:isoprenylcysteine carboxylmethyltransferase family protein [Nitrospirales bacterium]
MNQDNKNVWPSALSLTLVGVQFVLIGLIVFTGPLWPSEWSLRVITCRWRNGVGLWALQVTGLRQVNVFPEVSGQGKLIVLGPYRWVRHPMYSSVLLVTLAWMLGSPLLYRILLWVGLVMTLSIKLRYEERLLRERFSEYEAYRHRTKRLIPFVW